MQEELADIWKENLLEDIEAGDVQFTSVRDFLAELKKEFEGGNNESAKVIELKKIEQGGKIIEEFV